MTGFKGVLALGGVVTVAGQLPEYCSKIDTPAARKNFEGARRTPELSVEATQLGLRLLHVSSIIRHGARTPASRYECWPNYRPHWDCDVEEAVGPLLSKSAPEEDAVATMSAQPAVAFRKVYDVAPERDELGGTCGKGHLLREGYMQHQILGRLFAEYYQTLEEPLVGVGGGDQEAVADAVLFRASDFQRTMLSGSSFMNSFLATAKLEVPDYSMAIHTMDLANETILPNSHTCEPLQSLKEELFASGTFEEIESRFLHPRDTINKMSSSLAWPGEFFDCVMTALCTHGPNALTEVMPNIDYNVINDTIRAVDEYTAFQFTTRDRIYSKTANVKFMVEFKTELVRLLIVDITHRLGALQPALAAQMLAAVVPMQDLHEFYTLILQKRSAAFPFGMKRFILYSAHDTSILQFLGSLGEDAFFSKWPPYASQVIMEVFTNTDKYFFRLIYNGVVITDRIPECVNKSLPRDICELSSFFEATHWASPSKIEVLCGTSAN